MSHRTLEHIRTVLYPPGGLKYSRASRQLDSSLQVRRGEGIGSRPATGALTQLSG